MHASILLHVQEVCVRVYVGVCVGVCVYVCVWVCVSVYVCVYVGCRMAGGALKRSTLVQPPPVAIGQVGRSRNRPRLRTEGCQLWQARCIQPPLRAA